jgi:TatD DNase family protein
MRILLFIFSILSFHRDPFTGEEGVMFIFSLQTGTIMRLFDTHCHLQDERIFTKADECIARAREAGVVRMLCCGTRESDWDSVKTLSARYPEIVPAFGQHPWFVSERSEIWLEKLETILMEIPAAAVGEIGLDHALDERNDEAQAMVFTAQLKLARKLKRAVSIHCRKAWGSMIEIIEKQCGTPDGGVIHSYSGTPDLIRKLEALNISFSFSGSITYDRNKRGRASLAAVAERSLLVETDSPDIPPAGVGPEANEPAQCVAIVQKMAELRGTTAEKIGEITFRNATRIFTATDDTTPL